MIFGKGLYQRNGFSPRPIVVFLINYPTICLMARNVVLGRWVKLRFPDATFHQSIRDFSIA